MHSNKNYGEKVLRTTIITVMGIALALTAIAMSLPYYNSVATAQTKNQTGSGGGQKNNNTGIANINTIPKIANIPPGNNTQIMTKNRNIANPSTFGTFAKEHRVNASTPPTISQLPKNTTSSGNKK